MMDDGGHPKYHKMIVKLLVINFIIKLLAQLNIFTILKTEWSICIKKKREKRDKISLPFYITFLGHCLEQIDYSKVAP